MSDRPGRADDARHGHLPELGVGPRDHGRFSDLGGFHDDLLQVSGVDVRAADAYDVLDPLDDVEVAVLVKEPGIAATKPAVAERLTRRFGVAPVALHQVGAANDNLSNFERR